MEVVTATPASSNGVPPFHDHDVREWSRIDSLTGVLERARLETDRWAANTNNSCHKYGKVVDSRARSDADGGLQQQARRQLEVFQSQIPGGHLQVIKTHTVSSSRWTNKTTSSTSTTTPSNSVFENLQLSLNPLDLSSQKSKATVGRSVSRRPPSRQRVRNEPSSNVTNPVTNNNAHLTAATNLHRVSRLCHQIHESAVKQAFGRQSPSSSSRPPIQERQNGDGSVDVCEFECITNNNNNNTINTKLNGHTNLLRTKSTSSEDVHLVTPEKDSTTKSIEDLEDLEQLQNWRRTSKIRRSLQFPKQQPTTTVTTKPIDLPENSVSVRKIREDLEKGRRLSTALRGNTVDLQALDQILQSISSSSSLLSDKTPDDNLEDSENEQLITTNKKQKRNSFVTVESLQEVRGRLRRTSSPTINLYSIDKDKEVDDGIVTEDNNTSLIDMPEKSNQQSRVRSYVYGMEAMLSKKNIGTNSLESRTKLVNGNSTNRSEDWYNRRKSYGFEQVHSHQDTANSLKDKSMVESSTDSGICKSTEIVVIPSTTRTNNNYNDYTSDGGSDTEKHNGNDDIPHGNVKKIATIFAQDENNGFHDINSKKFNFRDTEWKRSPLKSTTITIPIAKNNNNIVDLSWNDEPVKEIKRHSIAVDESKYVLKNDDNIYRRTSLAINDSFNKNNYNQENDDDSLAQNRKTKKVEFCKTEVHFAADSGKVNIVETDEKPPPTHNFRRRRRNSGPINSLSDFNKNGLPMLHFGDTSYEKSMFSLNDDEYIDESKPENQNNNVLYENVQPKSSFGIVTVNTNTNINNNVIDYQEDERRDQLDIENIKGILKNKPIKPKPYHLGEQILLNDVNNSDEDMNKWGVRLRHVSKEETPIWKSTVTVHNMYNKSNNDIKGYNSSTDDDQPEFQKLLKNLRPTRKLDIVSDSEHRYSDSFSNIRVLSPVKDNRRSSWSVSDKVKYSDDNQNGENIRGYSTKVNFGNGEATVIENDSYFEKDIRHPTWPRTENSAKESKQLLNKGLVVRIGCEDSASNHTLCSKMTTTQDSNNTTTTTKITIDLSPSQELIDNNNYVPAAFASYTKYERSQNHSFKSTSLILNTIKNNTHTNSDNITKKQHTNNTKKNETNNKVPQQLEALKKLYEDVQSDSDADKEVQLLMSKITETDLNRIDNDNSSIVSGSWSKMRSYKTINETVNRKNTNEIQSSLDLTANTKVGKDKSDDRLILAEDSYNTNSNAKTEPQTKFIINATKNKFSPVVLRKTTPTTVRTEFKIADKLSSPFLVGKNLTNNTEHSDELLIPNGHISPVNEFKNVTDTKLQIKHTSDIVLRQPKKSEMTYFGVKVSPRPIKKPTQAVNLKENGLTDKPDLLQHYTTRKPTISSPKLSSKPRKKSPVSVKTPIYENLRPTTNKYKSKEFDSSILDELTKAADQIMQAVNGYTDEDSHNRFSTDDEENKIKKPLATISETKSWKKDKMQNDVKTTKQFNTKTKLKHTSSNSSIESFSKEKRTATPEIKANSIKTTSRKKINETTKATTKARRLQRASSREALLQSHGSSSEDLSINVETPLRKPRLVKKTKVAQLTMTNGLEINKKPSVISSRKKKEESVAPAKLEERITGVLPEIRHKTAVLTIRSTAEKNSRERAKQKIEEARKKAAQKRESNNRGVSSTRSEKNRNAVTNKETVTHRISTANIKKCHRSETGGPKQ